MKPSFSAAFLVIYTACLAPLHASDWPRFRGPDGSGVSPGEGPLPATWSETENLEWKTPLPGPGNSSPIIFGDRIFITCYSGYGVDPSRPGNMEDLQRHLLCIDSKGGEKIWEKTIPAEMPEDEYRGYLTEHGYASHTPVTDGERVYVFFGKGGALAFDFNTGDELWRTGLGKESSNRRWGSAASPILYEDTVIVNASEESQSIRALDKATGKEVWKAEASTLELVYNTPAVIEVDADRTDLVLALPNEVWGLNPGTGKLRWFAEMAPNGNISPSIVSDDEGTAYIFGGYRTKGSLAVRAGGRGDVTGSHVLWESEETSYIASPVLHEGHLYWVNRRGVVHCMDASSGELVYAEDVSGELASGPKARGFYASVTLADGKLYAPSRISGVFVFEAGPEFRQLAQNRFASDESEFNGSPAVSNGRIYLRSNRFLYCVGLDH